MIDTIRNLSLEEKEQLYLELGKMIDEERMDLTALSLRERVRVITGADIHEKSRRREVIIARVIFSNALLQSGATIILVGMEVGKDHATIDHYKKLLAKWKSMPRFFPEEIGCWNKLMQTI